jgi:hypothetical protein
VLLRIISPHRNPANILPDLLLWTALLRNGVGNLLVFSYYISVALEVGMLHAIAARVSQAESLGTRSKIRGKEILQPQERTRDHKKRRTNSGSVLRILAMSSMAIFCILIAGCAVSTRVTPDSGVGQQLLFRSLERAVAGLDGSRFSANQVAVDVFTLSDDRTRTFAREFLIARLKEQGLHIVPYNEGADLRFVVFLSVFGLDEDETLLGLPAFVAPLMGVTVPELAAYKSARNRGVAEVQLYAFDGRTGEFAGKTPVSVGHAMYDQHKALIVVNFTRSDIYRE